MKAILFVSLIVLVFYHLEFSEAGSESARNIYVDVDGNSPEIQDLAEFAAKETGYKLVSVERVGKKTQPDGSFYYKMVLELEDSRSRKRICVLIIWDKTENEGREIINSFCSGYH